MRTIDEALCERVCRTASQMGIRVRRNVLPIFGYSFSWQFPGAQGRQIEGPSEPSEKLALTRACRLLSEHLV